MGLAGGGTNVGVAQATITLNTSSVTAAVPVVASASAAMTSSLGGVGTAATGAQSGLSGLASVAGALGFSAGIAGAVMLSRELVHLGLDSIKAASDLTESINKIDVAFGSSGKAVLDWSKNSATALGQSQQRALEAASGFGLMFGTMQIGEKQAAQMSESLVQLASDMASINNVSPEEALIKLKAGLVGEAEPLRSMGVLLDEATVKAKAMAMGLAPSEAALTQQDKVLARYQLILEQTSKTQGDFARTSDGLANQERILEAHMGDLAASFGEQLLPAVLTTVDALNDLFGIMGKISKQGPLIELPAWMTANPLGNFLKNNHFTGDITGANSPYPFFAPNQLPDERSQMAAQQSASVRAGRANGALDVGHEAIFAWEQKRSDIAKQSIRDIADEETQYGKQRADTVENYNKNIARGAEDFALQRAQAEQSLQDSIAGVQADGARRQLQMAVDLARTIGNAQRDSAERLSHLQADLDRTNSERRADSADRIGAMDEDRDKSIADKRADSGKRLLGIEQDYNEARRRSEEQYTLSRRSAAERLDGRALADLDAQHKLESKQALGAKDKQIADEKDKLQEEVDKVNASYQERLADEKAALDKSIKQANEAHERQVDDEKESLGKRIANANDAYQIQLADGQAADKQRITDLNTAFGKEKTEAETAYGLRLERQKTDYDDQLTAMADAHKLRITQIGTHAEAERKALDDKFVKELDGLGLHNATMLAAQKTQQEDALKLFAAFWKALGINTGPTTMPDTSFLNERRKQLHGSVDSTAALLAVATDPAEIKRLTDLMNGLLAALDALGPATTAPAIGASSLGAVSPSAFSGSAFAFPSAPLAMAAGAGNRSLSVGNINVTVHGAPGQPVEQLNDIIAKEILYQIKTAAGRL